MSESTKVDHSSELLLAEVLRPSILDAFTRLMTDELLQAQERARQRRAEEQLETLVWERWSQLNPTENHDSLDSEPKDVFW